MTIHHYGPHSDIDLWEMTPADLEDMSLEELQCAVSEMQALDKRMEVRELKRSVMNKLSLLSR